MSIAQRWLPGTALGSFFERNTQLNRAREIDRLLNDLQLGTGRETPMGALLDLYASWGHPLTEVETSHLTSALQCAEVVDGPILQCGANLTTLILGKLCDGLAYREKRIVCLEENEHWADFIRSWLTQYQIRSVQVLTSRPRLHGGCVWYSVNPEKLPKNFALALCQGGKSQASGLASLVIRFTKNLAPNATLLGQQVRDPIEIQFLQRWAERHEHRCVTVDTASGYLKVIPITESEAVYSVKQL
ncbi:MAG: hypothetical protein AAF513_11235 [Pseudomonadota bacterium]